jgi:methionine-rich copper-binding protein CopC
MSVPKPISSQGARLTLSFLTGTVLSSGASAHAYPDHAIPPASSTLHGSPGEVKVWFTQAIEPTFSNLRVVDQNGPQVDGRNSAVDPSDRTLMRVSLPNLPPGRYRVFWRALSVDTHTTKGNFTFEVVP